VSINNIRTSTLTRVKLKAMFSNRDSKIFQFEAESVSLEAHISDVAFHGFVATKRTTRDKTTVTESIDDSIPVGTVLYSINNILTSSMTRGQLKAAFSSRVTKVEHVNMTVSTDIRAVNIDSLGAISATSEVHISDVAFHGFVATKRTTHDQAIVTESIDDSIPVGTVLYSVNNIRASTLTAGDLWRMFNGRLVKVQYTVTPGPHLTDLAFHGFVASKRIKREMTFVTESTLTGIVVGTELSKLNGVLTSELSPEDLRTMFSTRVSRIKYTVSHKNINNVTYDAAKYSKMLEEQTLFSICALCGEEGPTRGSVTVAECAVLLAETNIMDLYKQSIECITMVGTQATYNVQYAKQIECYLPNGLLRGETHICSYCYKTLSKSKVLNVETSGASGELSSESLSSNGSKINIRCLPKDALILGLFQGQIPQELSVLNSIETSMISIYSSITKMSLHGGKNYTIHGALSYTIVNDITSVARKLPRMPSVESTAILRHASNNKNKDYKFRPYYVKKALLWLKQNNHLYSNIAFEWPCEENWDDISGTSIAPYLPLSLSDINAIDDDKNEDNDGNITGISPLQNDMRYSVLH
jgi:hypothetical protein